MNWIAQLFGLLGLSFLMISIQYDNKKTVLFFQMFANVFYSIQYILLNSMSAVLMNLVSLIRSVVFLQI